MVHYSFPFLIQSLQRKLTTGILPGEEMHLKMAHAIRRVALPEDISHAKPAGVLIMLYEKPSLGLHVIMVRRISGQGRDKHAGQIAFPGGKRDPSDRDLMYTALREAGEEVAVDLTQVDVLGALSSLYIPVSKFLVHPYVSFVHGWPQLSPQETEIDTILDLPLSSFRAHEARQTTRIALTNRITLNHVPCFFIEGHVIWGATAMIMNELLELLN